MFFFEPLTVVHRLTHHANGFCARQSHHSPSAVLDAIDVRQVRPEAGLQFADLHAIYLPFNLATLGTRSRPKAESQIKKNLYPRAGIREALIRG